MGKPTGFKEHSRVDRTKRPTELRILDWHEVYVKPDDPTLTTQAARCMDCGIPFCNNGCPLGNDIPDWNDKVYLGDWQAALTSLLRTNNFPEWTGRICPAPCEHACVLAFNDKPVTIKSIEQAISDRGFAEGWITAQPPEKRTGKRVAVIGSGPAGLAAAQQLNRAGHEATVIERWDRPGGLLLYGIPDFKMDKSTVSRRIKLMEEEGIKFRCGVEVGKDVTMEQLNQEFDAVIVCIGACHPREVNVPGRELGGIHLAMSYLPQQTQENLRDVWPPNVAESIFAEQQIDAKGKHVIIIGGGDTAADCLGTAVRQGAKSVRQFDINTRPPDDVDPGAVWPDWPMTLKTKSWPAHEEAAKMVGHGTALEDVRDFAVLTKQFIANEAGQVRALEMVRIKTWKDESGKRYIEEVPGSAVELPCDLCLIAIGFDGPEKHGPIQQLGLDLTSRGAIKVDENYATSAPGVFAAGDARKGQSLVVWAISEGRQAARCCDEFLMGQSSLPRVDLPL